MKFFYPSTISSLDADDQLLLDALFERLEAGVNDIIKHEHLDCLLGSMKQKASQYPRIITQPLYGKEIYFLFLCYNIIDIYIYTAPVAKFSWAERCVETLKGAFENLLSLVNATGERDGIWKASRCFVAKLQLLAKSLFKDLNPDFILGQLIYVFDDQLGKYARFLEKSVLQVAQNKGKKDQVHLGDDIEKSYVSELKDEELGMVKKFKQSFTGHFINQYLYKLRDCTYADVSEKVLKGGFVDTFNKINDYFVEMAIEAIRLGQDKEFGGILEKQAQYYAGLQGDFSKACNKGSSSIDIFSCLMALSFMFLEFGEITEPRLQGAFKSTLLFDSKLDSDQDHIDQMVKWLNDIFLKEDCRYLDEESLRSCFDSFQSIIEDQLQLISYSSQLQDPEILF